MNFKTLFKEHFHIIMYTYFWFGLFICGLCAPDDRVALLESVLITQGWHLSILSLIFILPVTLIYLFKSKRGA